jgi:hypothetical protein
MKKALLTLVPLLVLFSGAIALAQDKGEKKEITVTGKVVCASCALKLVDKCAVGLDAGDEKYILVKNEASQKLYPKRYDDLTAMVTGTVEVKGTAKHPKKYLTATKIEVAETPKE